MCHIQFGITFYRRENSNVRERSHYIQCKHLEFPAWTSCKLHLEFIVELMSNCHLLVGSESSGAVIGLRSMMNALLEVINRMSRNKIELRICSIGWSSPAEDSC